MAVSSQQLVTRVAEN